MYHLFNYCYTSSSYVGHVTDTLALDRFLTEFKIVAKHNSRPWDLSASYLKRLFFEGSSARDRGFTKYGYNQESDLHSSELSVYMNNLLDHSILWKTDAHTVICTAFPYGTKEQIMHSFYSLNDCINGPSPLCIQYLDDMYHYSDQGDYMILISS